MSLLHHPEEELVLCSPMEGKITHNGIPVVGAKVERLIKWKDDVGQTDATTTDENGFFTLSIVIEKAKLPKLTQFVVAQELRVFYKGSEYQIWAKAKREKGLFDELYGIPVNFRCELTDELSLVDTGDDSSGMLLTSCKWDSIKKKE